MSPMRWSDIMAEMIELSREIIGEIKQQLTYYRASVYKHETAGMIQAKITHLRTVAKLLPGESLIESFKDYDATVSNGNTRTAPGECIFSSRVSSLLQSLETTMQAMEQELPRDQAQQGEIARNIQKHRSQLLKMCRYGSRQWAFFKTL